MKQPSSVAVLTGAARNIGRATALKLASLGFHIVLHTGSDQANLSKTIAMVRKVGVSCEGVVGALEDPSTIATLYDTAQSIGPCQILINNASVRKTCGFLDMTLEEWREVFSINCEAQFLCTQRFLPDMLKKGWGRVVCLGGLSAHTGALQRAAVVASKSAVPGLVRALAVEFAETNITFNCIVPGHITVERTAETGARLKHPNFEGKNVPYGQPDDIASMISMLVGENSGFINGQTIHINGGAYLP
ncbi:SDR family oxidoreductase [Litorivicinus sp.]|jgi:3-oxoacyl-[acyl-carrier protein] reductase|nr:SDR family oxidoreductase [Litorivicinus sp.]MDB9862181.1 SDR family oxidoreductase [Litorivicinus sp.]MDC1239794.1 SDR family oxidoreductase [Litorivicinus sp.]